MNLTPEQQLTRLKLGLKDALQSLKGKSLEDEATLSKTERLLHLHKEFKSWVNSEPCIHCVVYGVENYHWILIRQSDDYCLWRGDCTCGFTSLILWLEAAVEKGIEPEKCQELLTSIYYAQMDKIRLAERKEKEDRMKDVEKELSEIPEL
jgi:predicted nucleic acid-binding Zn finger protein